MTSVSIKKKLVALLAIIALVFAMVVVFATNAQADEQADENQQAIDAVDEESQQFIEGVTFINTESDISIDALQEYTGKDVTVYSVPSKFSSAFKITNGATKKDAGEYTLVLESKKADKYLFSGKYAKEKGKKAEIPWSIVNAISVPDDKIVEYSGHDINPDKVFVSENYSVFGKDHSGPGGPYDAKLTAKQGYAFKAASGSLSRETTVKWSIVKVINVPSAAPVEYTGKQIDTPIKNDPKNHYSRVDAGSDLVATAVGTYYVNVAADNDYAFKIDGALTKTAVATWSICEKKIPVPQNKEIEYTGESINTPFVDTAFYTVVAEGSTLQAQNVGEYTVKLQATDNYVFQTSKTETSKTVSAKWFITPQKIDVPAAQSVEYTGALVNTPFVDTDFYTVATEGSTLQAQHVGEYTVNLVATDNYIFKIGKTMTAKTARAKWAISPKKIEIPTAEPYVYDGENHVAPFIDNATYKVLYHGSTLKAKNAGKYTVKLQAEKNYIFNTSKGPEKIVDAVWEISKAKLAVPQQSEALTYTGALQQNNIVAEGLGKLYEVHFGTHVHFSTIEATDAGTYDVWYKLKDCAVVNYQWDTTQNQGDLEALGESDGLWACAQWTIGPMELSGDKVVEVTKGEKKKVDITCSGAHKDLVSLTFDGQEINIDGIEEVSSESINTVLEFTPEDIEKIAVGEHQIVFTYNSINENEQKNYVGDGDTASFTSTLIVKAAPAPDQKGNMAGTGDTALPIAVALVLVAAAAGIFVLRRKRD